MIWQLIITNCTLFIFQIVQDHFYQLKEVEIEQINIKFA